MIHSRMSEVRHSHWYGDFQECRRISLLSIPLLMGTGHHKYVAKILQLETLLGAELPEWLGMVLQQNWGINMSGKEGCFVPVDMEHEFYNKDFKHFHSGASSLLNSEHSDILTEARPVLEDVAVKWEAEVGIQQERFERKQRETKTRRERVGAISGFFANLETLTAKAGGRMLHKDVFGNCEGIGIAEFLAFFSRFQNAKLRVGGWWELVTLEDDSSNAGLGQEPEHSQSSGEVFQEPGVGVSEDDEGLGYDRDAFLASAP